MRKKSAYSPALEGVLRAIDHGCCTPFRTSINLTFVVKKPGAVSDSGRCSQQELPGNSKPAGANNQTSGFLATSPFSKTTMIFNVSSAFCAKVKGGFLSMKSR